MLSITIHDALVKLQQMKAESTLGDETVLVLSLTGSEISNVPIDDLVLVSDNDGAVVEVRARPSPGLGDLGCVDGCSGCGYGNGCFPNYFGT